GKQLQNCSLKYWRDVSKNGRALNTSYVVVILDTSQLPSFAHLSNLHVSQFACKLDSLWSLLVQRMGILYAEFLHLQIPLPEIVTATSNFAAENLIKEDSFGKDYKGQMLRSGQLTDIVARRLDCIYGQEVKLFGAISIHSSLQHKNIISFIGFCNENDEKIIIYEHAARGSLDQHLTDATLTWLRRLQICIGVARALSHVHYDVIHCDINSSKVFLDKDWEAKLSGFELSTKYPENWRHRILFSHHFDSSGNIDPMYLKSAIVTPKYDVYSFGVILFEVLCGRKATIGDSGVDQSLAEMAKRHFEDRKLDEIIVEGLRKQMDLESLTIFSNTAYNCLKEGVQRPTMDQVVRDLEEALEHQWKRDNIGQSAAADEDLSSNHLKSENLECLRIHLSDIKVATNSFDDKYCVGSGGYGKVYKADLDHLDIERFSSAREGKNNNELPKRRSTVAIKQILDRQDEQGKQGFLAEIELLTSCKHQNIVSLLGFSSTEREMILVYEFLVNGSLDGYLHGRQTEDNTSRHQSANVLLDVNWNAKIADFGLSKFHPANQLASTIKTKGFAGTESHVSQESLKRDLEISLENIKVATREFSQENCVGSGRDWKLYKGELSHAKANANATERTTIVAKQWIRKYGQENNQFRTELDVLFNHKHEDIISLAGYCDEQGETIIVYKHVWNGSLDEHLNNVNLIWIKRLQICVDIASGLEFLHGGGVTQDKLVHGNVKSANILLTADWKVKISNFEFSSDSLHQHIDHVSDHAYGTFAYLDPEYTISGILTDKSDLYSFGVILVEILCGRLAWGNGCEDQSQSLGPLAKRRFEEGKLNEMVFEGIKKEIVPESYSSFSNIAYECLRDDGYERPEAREVVLQLKKALEIQEDKEIWEPMLPRNYREIIDMSKTPGIYSINKKKDLYRMLSDGMFLQEGKVWFSLSKIGKGNAMISATMFSYGNRTSHKWRYIQRSRDDDGWTMIELCRFLNQKEITVFEVSLESFSRYYCGSGAIYVQGIEFHAIENARLKIYFMKQEEIRIFNGNQQVPKPDVKMQQMPNDLGETVKGFEHDPDGNMISVQSEVNGMKHLMISATKVLFNSPKMKFFHPKPSAESRFQNVMELLPQQVFRIKYKIESEKLSPFTEYMCYLVFKLSEKCRELHCPVKVRDLLHRRNKETKTLYFRTPAPFNRHDANFVEADSL
ncbi:kinase-like domain, phloem protein 2-like protein, partial [Tanacetum coccineum]